MLTVNIIFELEWSCSSNSLKFTCWFIWSLKQWAMWIGYWSANNPTRTYNSSIRPIHFYLQTKPLETYDTVILIMDAQKTLLGGGWRHFDVHKQNLGVPPLSADWPNLGTPLRIGRILVPLPKYIYIIFNNTHVFYGLIWAILVFWFKRLANSGYIPSHK